MTPSNGAGQVGAGLDRVGPGGTGPDSTAPDHPERTWAAVPFRGRSGKRRLAGLLDGEERRRLVLALLGDVLAALLSVPTIERVLVVAPAGVALPEGTDGRVVLLPERVDDGDDPIGLNPALARAQSVAADAGVERLLIVPADLPLLRPSDVAALLGAAVALQAVRGAVIAPDAAGRGTNALVLTPPTCLSPRFGEDSFRAHAAEATERGVAHAVVRRPGLDLDLDTPADIVRLLASGSTGRTGALVRSLDLNARLAAVARA